MIYMTSKINKVKDFFRREPTKTELRRGKHEARGLGLIIAVFFSEILEYFLNIEIPVIIKWVVLVVLLVFLSEKLFSRHLGKRLGKSEKDENKKKEGFFKKIFKLLLLIFLGFIFVLFIIFLLIIFE